MWWRALQWAAVAVAAGASPWAWAEHAPALLQVGIGVADPGQSGVALGPALELSGMYGLSDQAFVTAAITGETHGLDGPFSRRQLRIGQLLLGGALVLDVAPVTPLLDAGLALQAQAATGDVGFGVAPYIGLGLVLPLRAPWVAALEVRYQAASLLDTQDVGSTQLWISFGGGSALTRW